MPTLFKMDALLIDDGSFNTFQRFDDKLGTLIDVTYFYEGILTAQGFNDGDGVVASDWEGGIDIEVKAIVNRVLVGIEIINIGSFDIERGDVSDVSFSFEAGGNVLASSPDGRFVCF